MGELEIRRYRERRGVIGVDQIEDRFVVLEKRGRQSGFAGMRVIAAGDDREGIGVVGKWLNRLTR